MRSISLSGNILALAAVAAMGVACPAFGQVWTEVGDAPEGVPARQVTVGTGPMTAITGGLNRALGDHTDTYCLRVTDPATFLASTKIFFGGSATTSIGANADTRLWLWSNTGAMLLANDDVNQPAQGTDTLASLISDPSTFSALSGGELVNATAAGFSLVAGTEYLLSISLFSNDPDDAAGVDQANLGADFDALHGKNPASGAFAAWENGASTTIATYRIALGGATFNDVPDATPVPLPSSALGGLALITGIGLAKLKLCGRHKPAFEA